jgi:hypothetical protein
MAYSTDARSLYLIKLGGALGIASAFIGLAVFLGGMFGFSAVFMLSILPLALGAIGTVMIIIGSVCHVPGGSDETAPIAGLFCCFFGLIFGAIGLYVWMHMPAAAGA